MNETHDENQPREQQTPSEQDAPREQPAQAEFPKLPPLAQSAPQPQQQPQAQQPQRPYGVPETGYRERPQHAQQSLHADRIAQHPDQHGPSFSSQLGPSAANSRFSHQPGQAHPGQQPGQQPYGPAPQQAPHSAGSRPAKPRRGSRATPWLIIALPIMLVVGAVAGYMLATNYNSFDNQAVEDAVANVLRTDYGMSDLRSVDCPNWIKVEQGDSFQCEFQYAGGTQTVTVTQGSQSGQLVVGAPE
ncbi:DUF4333 domain-containing protein [Gulosibacter faecalis]|uniref:DUF4333 domain-containing protein n=1 Tax=Gulosibacter faecalis TaxID=272240 RepID=A0ABW5UVF0_9MICO|nr:DUF4333 domain-containing protein [Gulosibacter faecalis]